MLLSTRFGEALVYASEIHIRQLRKGTAVPYISHLLAVTALCLEHGANEEIAIAALLHDSAEDTGGQARLDDIKRRFGDQVAFCVEQCSDSLTELPSEKTPWRARKEAHLAALAHVPPEVALIVACDKLHNARCTISDLRTANVDFWGKFKGGKAGTLWYLRATAEIVSRSISPALANELGRAISEIEQLAGP